MLDEIRIADNFLKNVDERKIGWDGGNYFMSILGSPSASRPWMLQIGGHHVAYNLTFNGAAKARRRCFFGSEPIYFNMAIRNTNRSPRRARPCRVLHARWRRTSRQNSRERSPMS